MLDVAHVLGWGWGAVLCREPPRSLCHMLKGVDKIQKKERSSPGDTAAEQGTERSIGRLLWLKPRASLGREMSRSGRFFRLHLHNMQGGHDLEGTVSVTVHKPTPRSQEDHKWLIW